MKHIKLMILCASVLFLVFSKTFIEAQATPPSVYQGDIKHNDLRLTDLRKNILNQQKAPNQIRLRYSRTHLDFAVFYDLDGHEIYYKYREDRFDLRSSKKLRSLIKGQAYLVYGPFLGVWFQSKLTAKSSTKYNEALENKDAPLVFEYVKNRPLRLDEILL